MSASRRSICPRCTARARAKSEAMMASARTAYGQVPEAEYAAMTAAAAAAAVPPGGSRTLEEYYEVYGAESGTVTVEYGAGCEACGLSAGFKHEYVLPAGPPEAGG